MLAFGLGTFPAMLLMGGLGAWVGGARGGPLGYATASPLGKTPGRWRRRGVDLAGVFIIVLGIVTFARGIVPLSGHPHVL
jgi:sulfite exporter TauE/SafE